MNTRRVQLTGTSTYTISLPKEWAMRQQVGRGSKLSVSESPTGSLVIGKEEHVRERDAEVGVDAFYGENLRRRLIALYLSGATKMRFYTYGKEMPASKREMLLEETRRLIGTEVIEETPSSITIEYFFSEKDLSIKRAFSRMHLLVGNLLEDLVKAMAKGDYESAKAVRLRDDEVDRLKFLILRQINGALLDARIMLAVGLRSIDAINYAVATRNLEHIADEITIAAGYYSELSGQQALGKSKNDTLVSFGKSLSGQYKATIDAFLAGDAETAQNIIESSKQLESARLDVLAALSKDPTKAPVQYPLIVDKLCDSVNQYCIEIAEITINMKGE